MTVGFCNLRPSVTGEGRGDPEAVLRRKPLEAKKRVMSCGHFRGHVLAVEIWER
jgi:hypothetical protein